MTLSDKHFDVELYHNRIALRGILVKIIAGKDKQRDRSRVGVRAISWESWESLES